MLLFALLAMTSAPYIVQAEPDSDWYPRPTPIEVQIEASQGDSLSFDYGWSLATRGRSEAMALIVVSGPLFTARLGDSIEGFAGGAESSTFAGYWSSLLPEDGLYTICIVAEGWQGGMGAGSRGGYSASAQIDNVELQLDAIVPEPPTELLLCVATCIVAIALKRAALKPASLKRVSL